MKGLKKNNLEVEAAKTEMIEKEKKEENRKKQAKKPRTNRFLAFLRCTWKMITGCVRPLRVNPEEGPGPKNIKQADCSVNICHELKEAEDNVPEIQSNVSSADRNMDMEMSSVSSAVIISHEEKEAEDGWEPMGRSEPGFGGEDCEEENWEEEPKYEPHENWEQEYIPPEDWESDYNPPEDWEQEDNPPEDWESEHNPPEDWESEHNPPEDWESEHNPPEDWESEHNPPEDWESEHNPPEDWESEHNPPEDWESEHNPPEDWESEHNPPEDWESEHNPPEDWESEHNPPEDWESEHNPPEDWESEYNPPEDWESEYNPPEDWESEYTPINIRADDCVGTPSATAPLYIDHFTFHKVLGAGGYGKVYLATDKIRKQSVAIKAMAKWEIVKKKVSFKEEGDVLQISHKCPHLIHGLGAFHTPDQIFFVMELASGGHLGDFQVQNFPLELSPIQFIAAELTCGVTFLHNNAILHRDLKPENILLVGDGHLKITDFGISATGFTEDIEGWGAGTVGYIAPEIMKFKPHGPGVDYFAIGVIVYELFTSQRPFPGRNERDYRTSLQCDPDYPQFMAEDLVSFIDRLLCKNPQQRLGVSGDIKEHHYFRNINWEEMEAGRAEPPDVLKSFSRQSMMSVPDSEKISDKDQDMFNRFGFVCPEWAQQYRPKII